MPPRTAPKTETTKKTTQTRTGKRELLPLSQVLAELGDDTGPLSRHTFDKWRRRGVAPRVIQLPNRELRVDREDFNTWLDTRTTGLA